MAAAAPSAAWPFLEVPFRFGLCPAVPINGPGVALGSSTPWAQARGWMHGGVGVEASYGKHS